VVEFLSQEWLDAQREATADLPPAPDAGGAVLVQHVVTGAPSGNVSYTTSFADGRIVDGALGASASEPDLTITATYGDAARLATGELELSAAYMQGTVKVEGSMSTLFSLLPATHRPEFVAAIKAVGSTVSV
jgi:hypothetical protein